MDAVWYLELGGSQEFVIGFGDQEACPVQDFVPGFVGDEIGKALGFGFLLGVRWSCDTTVSVGVQRSNFRVEDALSPNLPISHPLFSCLPQQGG
jgi:hypothetical protein